MNAMIIVAAIGLVGLIVGVVWLRRQAAGAQLSDDVFDRARASENDALTRFFIDAGRPLSGFPVVSDRESTLYRYCQRKILASGGAYGGSVEVFVAAQTLAALLAAAILLLTVGGVFSVLLGPGMLSTGLGVGAAGVVLVLPSVGVNRKARVRISEIGKGLPEFAEILQMPLTAGQTVMASLDFTARHTTGPVSAEAANIVLLTRTRTVSDAEAFQMAGRRLVLPEAQAFFNALAQAHIEGSKVVEVLSRQAESLRNAQHQRQREELKKLPVKLIVIFALHLMPAVFVLVAFNFISAFANL